MMENLKMNNGDKYSKLEACFKREGCMNDGCCRCVAKIKFNDDLSAKYQESIKKRYVKLLKDLNEVANNHHFSIDVEWHIEDIKHLSRIINMSEIYDLERLLVSDFHDGVEYMLKSFKDGHNPVLIGCSILRLKTIDDKNKDDSL